MKTAISTLSRIAIAAIAACAISGGKAEAALVTVDSALFDISGNGGSQGYGLKLTGLAGDTFTADFNFKVIDADAHLVGSTSIENNRNAILSFTSFDLYDSSDVLIATGAVGLTPSGLDIGSLLEAITLTEGDEYYVRTSGSFLSSGRAAIGGTVSLAPVPVPAALPLMISAIGALGVIGARRRR